MTCTNNASNIASASTTTTTTAALSYTITDNAGNSTTCSKTANESGVVGYQYSIDNGATYSGTTGTAFNVGINSPFTHYITVRGVNSVGIAGPSSSVLAVNSHAIVGFQAYIYCLGRLPSIDEVNGIIGHNYNYYNTASNLVYSFCASAEFASYYGGNYSNYVYGLYRGVFGREPDTDGYNYYLGLMGSYGYQYFAKEFVNSAEFKQYCNLYGLYCETIP